jgi:aspartate/methionine/tyrosine aminotransferase
MRGESRILTAPSIRDGRFNPSVYEEALHGEPASAPAVAVANFPTNPGGYMPTAPERAQLVASLISLAASRPLVVICDDAYEGLVYDAAVPRTSLFWDLVGVHPNLLPVKIDGATKEYAFFGGRIGFVSLGLAADSPAAAALDDKLLGLIRSSVGSPVAASQVVLLQALRDGDVAAEIESVRVRLERRYVVLQDALSRADDRYLRPIPCNAGCFALAALPDGVEPEAVRRHLLENEDAGVIAVPPSYVRLAFCSLSRQAIPELVRRTERGVAALCADPP